MKITHLLAAATIVAGLGVSTTASAEPYRHDGRQHARYEHREYRHGYRGGWHGYGRHHGGGYHGRRCHTEYRHHRRITVCYR